MTTTEPATTAPASPGRAAGGEVPIDRRPARTPTRQPLGAPPPAAAAVLLALLILAVAVLAVHSAVVHAEWIDGPSWAGSAARRADGAEPQDWWVIIAVAAVLIGLLLLGVAVKRRRRTAVAITGSAPPTGVTLWTRPVDLARLAGAAARRTAGVREAEASATRSRVRVRVRTDAADTGEIRERVAEAVAQRLGPVAATVRVRVTVTATGADR